MTVDATTTYDSPSGWRAVGRYGLLVVVSVIVLFPIYTTVVAALKPGNEVLDNPLVPGPFTLDVLQEAWTDGRLGRYLLNSLIVATVITVAQVVTSVLSGYAFAVLEFPGRSVLFVLFLATLLVPLEATIVVNRETVDSLGWLNSYAGLTVPFLATALGTFLIRQAFLTLPARPPGRGVDRRRGPRRLPAPRRRAPRPPHHRGDGAAELPVGLRPVPVAQPHHHRVRPLHRAERAAQLSRSSIDQPNLVMAGVLIAAVPIVIVLLVFQRQLLRGLTSGAVKG